MKSKIMSFLSEYSSAVKNAGFGVATVVVAGQAFAVDSTLQTQIDTAVTGTSTITTSLVAGLIGIAVGITGLGIIMRLLNR